MWRQITPSLCKQSERHGYIMTTTLFGDSMGLAHRILIRFLLILKGDFAATFRLSCELITINLTYGDQLIKGEDPLEVDSPPPFFCMPRKLSESIEKRFIFRLRGSPPSRESQLWGHMRGSQALPPRSYTPNRSLTASIRIDPCPARQTTWH